MTDIRGKKYKTIPFADNMIIYLQKSTNRKKILRITLKTMTWLEKNPKNRA